MIYKALKAFGKVKKGDLIYCIPLTQEENISSKGCLIIDKEKARELLIKKQIKY